MAAFQSPCAWFRAGLLLGLLLGGHPAPAQPAQPDSLLAALRTEPTDTARAKTALRLSAALAPTDTAGASRYARQALAWSSHSGFGYGQAHAWLQLGAMAIIRHDPARAAACGERAQAAARPLPATPRVQRLRASIANNLGNVAEQRGQYQAAVTFYLQAAALLTGLPPAERTTLLTVYSNLGNCWQVLGQPDQALAYWQRALALAPGPEPALMPVYLHLAGLHLQRARTDSMQASLVRRYLRSARPLLAANQLYSSSYYGTLGEYYVYKQRPTQARLALAQALAAATRQGSAAQQAKVLFALGQVEWQLGQPAQARSSLAHSLALTQQLGDPQQVIDDLQALGQLEEQAGRWQAALGYYQRGQHLHDSLASATVRQRVSLLETQYRTREQARQLRELRHEQQAQQRALRQQRRLSAVYLGLALALAGLGALGLRLLRNRQRLARQQQALHAQHLRQLAQEKALQVAQAVLEGQEEERTRVARDLHDGLGGMLATVRLYLGTARARPDLPPEPAQLVAQSVAHLDSSIGELRRVARNLMPEAMLTFGLARALQDLCEAVQQAGTLQVQLQTYGLEARLPHATEVALYRMVQELLTNVVRHAQASHVLVQLMRYPDALHLVVEDDGQGFDTTLGRAGVGLRSVRARAAYLDGTLDVQSTPGQGTTCSFELALPAAGS
jgi:two-component system NarL family sensor kinase